MFHIFSFITIIIIIIIIILIMIVVKVSLIPTPLTAGSVTDNKSLLYDRL